MDKRVKPRHFLIAEGELNSRYPSLDIIHSALNPTMEPSRELKVLALGLPRTGTLSMAHALRMLGYDKVHHTIDHPEEETWKNLSRAADATFPSLPT
jgi:hypothetical protein